MPYIPTEPVESSNLERVGYDRKTSTLRVIFHGGRTYDYPMVPPQEYRKLLEAESKGKFFNTRIKPMYGYRTPRPEELEAPNEEADLCAHERREATEDGSIVVCADWMVPSWSAPTVGSIVVCADCGIDLMGEPVEVIEVPPPFWSPIGCDQGCEDQDFMCEGEHTTHAHGIEEHDHEGGDECHVHDADGLPVAVPPPALPRTPTGEVDYAAIPDASHLFEDPQSVPGHEGEVSVPDESGGWKPIGPHEHPQLTSESDD